MLISIAEYAKLVKKHARVVRHHCETGKFRTAQKIGRNWVIDSEEPYIEASRKREGKADKEASES